MSNYSDDSAAQAVPVVGNEGERQYRSKRGRRMMMVVLILLVFLLLVATLFLLNLIRPKGEIASKEDAGQVTWVRSIYGWGDMPNEQLVAPAVVGFNNSGDLVIPNTGADVVAGLRFDNSGVYKDMFAGDDKGRLAYPTGVDVAPDGRMYFLQGPRNEILVLDRAGKKTERVMNVDIPTAIDVTEDRIAIGARDGWVITDLDGNIVLGPVGTRGKGPDQYDVVSGIALDADNNVYVVDTYNNRISKFDSRGKRLWITDAGNPSNQAANTGGESMKATVPEGSAGLQSPTSAVLDGAGHLVVVDPLDFTIALFDTKTGKFVNKYGTFGKSDGQFMYPSSIDYDPVRDWFAVADTMNNRVQIVRLPGTGGSPASAFARSLTGPIRACLIPLLLLLIALIVWAVRRRRAKKQREAAAAAAAGVAAPQFAVAETTSAE